MNTFNLRVCWAACLLLFFPASVWAVGLGKLSVLSALGQPLRAEIALLSVSKEELGSLTARTASATAYKDANLERSGIAASFKYTVAQRSNGEPYLKITSTQAVNEPFLDLLIELSWSSGRLLREYTVLLDPPGFAAPEPVAPIAAPQIKSPAPVAERPAISEATPRVATTQPPAASPRTATTRPSKRAGAVARTPKPEPTIAEQTFPKFDEPESATATATPSATKPATPAENYSVKRGDTLNKIASQLKPEGISLEQMLAGLYQTNPQAFIDKNMNRLRVGQILRVPDQGELANIDQASAAKQVKAHVADWNAYRQKLAQTAESTPATDEAAKQSASGTITSAVEDKAAAASPSKDVLKLSKGEAPGAKKLDSGAGAAERLRALEEENIAKEKSLKEANSRVAALEANIKDMQRLLEIRSQALADLQKQANKSAPAPVTTAPAPAIAPSKPAPTTAAPVAPTTAPTAGSSAPAVTAPAPTTTAPVTTPPLTPSAGAPAPILRALPDSPTTGATSPAPAAPPTASAEKPVVSTDKTTQPSAPAKPAGPAVKPAPTPVAKAEESSFLSSFVDNPLYLGAAVIAILLLAALGLMWRSNQRRRSLSSFEDSIMTGGDLKANTVFGDTSGGVIDTGDTSFLTDFSQAGMGTIDTNDVDPIAEAEVYMAYGRDAQAEEILKEALTKDPSRHEIQVKLLEIYAARKNVSAFETLAGELYAAIGGRSHPLWHKVAEMGRELDPSNPLYASEAGGGTAAAAAAGGIAGLAAANALADEQREKEIEEDLIGDLDFPLDQAEEPAISFDLDKESSSHERNEIEFEPAQQSFHEAKAPEAPAPSEEKTSSLDFDSIIPQAVEKQASYMPETESADTLRFTDQPAENQADDAMEFELDLQESLESPPAIESAVDTTEEEFNNAYQSAAQNTAQQARAADVDLSHIDLNLGDQSVAKEDFDADMVFTDTESHWQEVATKLDLAKAYMDMGDKDGAREILQEVVEEGEPEQKSDAKKLLAALA